MTQPSRVLRTCAESDKNQALCALGDSHLSPNYTVNDAEDATDTGISSKQRLMSVWNVGVTRAHNSISYVVLL